VPSTAERHLPIASHPTMRASDPCSKGANAIGPGAMKNTKIQIDQ